MLAQNKMTVTIRTFRFLNINSNLHYTYNVFFSLVRLNRYLKFEKQVYPCQKKVGYVIFFKINKSIEKLKRNKFKGNKLYKADILKLYICTYTYSLIIVIIVTY